ncbi:MAG TPA: PxKF domain-containing protein [Thermoleophilaceae bacterium]
MLTLALAPGAFAANEVGDAGDLRVTANDMGDSAVTQINGAFTDAMDADVYRICLTDGASFSASTVGGTSPTTLDTQLFLLDAQGYGVYMNDDAATGIRGSTLPAQHRFSPTAGGEYFLAVSQYNRDPQSSQGEIFQDNFSRWQFPDGVIFANGFGAAETLSGWNGRAPGGLGTYRITLTGTRACVPPDTTPPTVDLRSPVDGSHVKQGADVVVDFSCADEGSSGLASCVGSTPDGEKLDTSKLGPVTVTVTARDKAGNETVAKSTVTVEDRTDPTVTLTTPADGAEYERGEHVAAAYGCADEANGSGLDSCVGDVPNGADVDTTTLGEHSFTVTATDRAGNHASAVAHYTVVDVTAPQITLTTPSQGAVYDLGQQVAASYSCADEDGGSGLASCAGTVAGGAGIDTASVGDKSFTVSATDHAGNPASRTVTYTVVDRAAPVITLNSPTDGAVYGFGDSVLADYSCADQPGGSGLATCTGTVPNGEAIDTSSFGSHTFEVHATDGAGNPATRTVTYSVVYEFDGFFWPVKNPPNVTRWKAGVPVPVRFSLHGFRGARPEADGYPRSMGCGGGDVEQVARAAQGKKKGAFEYERGSDRYMMLWKTDKKWAGTCREFVLKLDDGSVHAARFEFGKKRGRKR